MPNPSKISTFSLGESRDCLWAMPSRENALFTRIRFFNDHEVRAVWYEENNKWWFSVLDIIAILTGQPDYKKVRNYWKWLKNKLKAEGSEVVSITNQWKLIVPDGKMRMTDVVDT